MSEVKAKKKFGQNFLKDQSVIEKIVRSFDASLFKNAIEIGPGKGALTKRLVRIVENVKAYEIDPECIEYLKETIKSDNLEIIPQDFLKADLSYLKDINDAVCISNIPYYITSPIISKFLFEMPTVKEATFMVQKEVGERLLAEVGTKDYNSFTILVQYYVDVKRIINVNRTSFIPAPNVDSVVIKLTRRVREYKPKDEKLFIELVETSFKERRKMLTNNLNGFKSLSKDDVQSMLVELGRDEMVRAEVLSIDEFIRLSDLILKWEK